MGSLLLLCDVVVKLSCRRGSATAESPRAPLGPHQGDPRIMRVPLPLPSPSHFFKRSTIQKGCVVSEYIPTILRDGFKKIHSRAFLQCLITREFAMIFHSGR